MAQSTKKVSAAGKADAPPSKSKQQHDQDGEVGQTEAVNVGHAKKESAAEWVKLSELKAWSKNPRKNDATVVKVADSIKRFGFGAPILARRADGEIIAGHTRFRAAQKLGLDLVPVRFLDLDPADAHLLALADNRLQEFSSWDDDTLLQLLGDLRQQDNDAAKVAGWTDTEIDELLKETWPDPAEESGPELGALQYSIVVECRDEAHQAEMLAKLEGEGLPCKPLIS